MRRLQACGFTLRSTYMITPDSSNSLSSMTGMRAISNCSIAGSKIHHDLFQTSGLLDALKSKPASKAMTGKNSTVDHVTMADTRSPSSVKLSCSRFPIMRRADSKSVRLSNRPPYDKMTGGRSRRSSLDASSRILEVTAKSPMQNPNDIFALFRKLIAFWHEDGFR